MILAGSRMKRKTPLIILFAGLGLASCTREIPLPAGYPIEGIPTGNVMIGGGFWGDILQTSRRETLPHCLEFCERTGRIENFARAAGLSEGPHQGERYNDSDVYKIIQGAACHLMGSRDPDLENQIDSIIGLIAGAQEADGYLYTSRTIDPGSNIPGSGKVRWADVWISHELYNAGHLYEAAVAYYEATGKRELLDVALKNAGLVISVFNEEGMLLAPGHQEIEIGLVKLYQATGERKYLDQALFFLDQRGRKVDREREPEGTRFEIYNEPSYLQYHLPVRQQREAVGHAVRAMYQYAGMTDVGILSGDTALLDAVKELWNDIVQSKIYLTGGIGASHRGEAFSSPFVLPNERAYCETCAAAGSILWNHRMFRLTGDTRYLDLLEITLYNGFLSGVSLDGRRFFYTNPLESNGRYQRSEWFGVACCPGNVARIIPSLPGLIYSRTEETLFVNLYIESRVDVVFSGTTFHVEQLTDYPWQGKIRLKVTPEKPAVLRIRFRVPGWVTDAFMPGGLYSYTDRNSNEIHVSLNGERMDYSPGEAIVIERRWEAGDEIEIDFPMPVHTVRADARVEDDRGKRAVVRGPLVYAAEGIDHGGTVSDLRLSGDESWDQMPGILNGVTLIRAGELTLIPYFTWANRGSSDMRVWIPLDRPG